MPQCWGGAIPPPSPPPGCLGQPPEPSSTSVLSCGGAGAWPLGKQGLPALPKWGKRELGGHVTSLGRLQRKTEAFGSRGVLRATFSALRGGGTALTLRSKGIELHSVSGKMEIRSWSRLAPVSPPRPGVSSHRKHQRWWACKRDLICRPGGEATRMPGIFESCCVCVSYTPYKVSTGPSAHPPKLCYHHLRVPACVSASSSFPPSGHPGSVLPSKLGHEVINTARSWSFTVAKPQGCPLDIHKTIPESWTRAASPTPSPVLVPLVSNECPHAQGAGGWGAAGALVHA